MDETSALIPSRSPDALTPDAILDGPVHLRGEHDPDEARRRAREAAMALENLPYHMATAAEGIVRAFQPIIASFTEAVASISNLASTPEMRRLALDLGLAVDGQPYRPTRYERRMARVAVTPRRRKRRRH